MWLVYFNPKSKIVSYGLGFEKLLSLKPVLFYVV